MLQEQVSEYLGVTSFKRKYPGEKGTLYINTVVLLFKTVALQHCIVYEDTGLLYWKKNYKKKKN